MFQCALFSGAAAAVKWLKVPGEAHVTSSRAGPSPPPPYRFLSLLVQRETKSARGVKHQRNE